MEWLLLYPYIFSYRDIAQKSSFDLSNSIISFTINYFMRIVCIWSAHDMRTS